MYTSIVVPLDGLPFANRALPMALALACRTGAAICLVHVQEPLMLSAGTPRYDAPLYHDLLQETRSQLTAIAAQLTQETSLVVDAEFLDGPVVETLEQHLAGGRHDLVVMMTHGRSGLSRAWEGSVADGLAMLASVPLLLMREETAPMEPAEPLFRRVLVPLDGSALAEEVLDHLVSLSTPDVTVYVLLSIMVPSRPLEYPDSVSLSDPVDEGSQRDGVQAYLTGVARELRDSGALVEVCVEMHEHAAHGILAAAAQQHVDLIALSTHGRGALSRLVHGSVTDAVVRGATVPTLVFRPVRGGAASTERERASVTAPLGAQTEVSDPADGRSPRAAA